MSGELPPTAGGNKSLGRAYKLSTGSQSGKGSPLDFLQGTWLGRGRGEYPTLRQDFTYLEEICITHDPTNPRPVLQWRQRSWSMTQPPKLMHVETGWVRALSILTEQGHPRVEVILSAQNGVNTIEEGYVRENVIHLHSSSISRSATARAPFATEFHRRFEVDLSQDPPLLHYTMDMATTTTPHVTRHLEAWLNKQPQAPGPTDQGPSLAELSQAVLGYVTPRSASPSAISGLITRTHSSGGYAPPTVPRSLPPATCPFANGGSPTGSPPKPIASHHSATGSPYGTMGSTDVVNLLRQACHDQSRQGSFTASEHACPMADSSTTLTASSSPTEQVLPNGLHAAVPNGLHAAESDGALLLHDMPIASLPTQQVQQSPKGCPCGLDAALGRLALRDGALNGPLSSEAELSFTL